MSDEGFVVLFATVVLGGLLPFISEWLNVQFHANAGKAFAIAGLLSGVLALLVMVLTGNLTVADFDVTNFAHVFTGVFTVGTVFFNLIKGTLGWDNKER